MRNSGRFTQPFTAFFAIAIGLNFVAGASPQQKNSDEPLPSTPEVQLLSYEGENISTVEMAGRPHLNSKDFEGLVAQRSGEPLSSAKIDKTLAALKATGKFQDVHLDLRPEPEGVRVRFILQPAIYFGMYQFTGAKRFSYARLLQVTSYSAQEPYSPVDIDKAQDSLQTFLRRNGYFEAQIEPTVETDESNGLANVTFHVTLNRLAKFGEVVITGASREETQHLKSVLHSLRARMYTAAIRSGKKYSLNTLQNATRFLESRLAKQHRLEARVRLIGAAYNPETNRADISFEVQPGPVVEVKVEGARVGGGTKRKLLPIYEQTGLTPELIQEGRQNLLSHFRSKGFFDVAVESDVRSQATGEVVLYRIKKGPRKKIVDVAFSGNQHLPEDELEEHVSVDKAGLLSKGKYDESSIKSLTAFYRSKGFNEAKVTPQFADDNGRVVVTFVVEEGPQDVVESVRIEGNETVPQIQFAPDGLRIAPGQPYAQKSVDDDRNKIMTHYLELGYLTATFKATAEATPGDPHHFNVVYTIAEGPQVHADNVVTLGRSHTKQAFINRDIAALQPGQPLTEREIFASESRLYTTGIFDWAQVSPRRQISSQTKEDVIVKVHEARRNALTYGFGFEVVNRGGSVPTGTVAVPGLPPVGLPSTFKVSQHSFKGIRANFLYTRNNVRGKAESITIGALTAPLLRRATAVYTNPTLRWTSWTANFTATGERSRENPIYSARQAQLGFQLQRALDRDKKQNLFLRYTITQTGLTELLIPALVPKEDLHTRLSTLSGTYIHDTRDNLLDARTGMLQSVQLDFNPRALGSSVNFAKLLAQAAYYRTISSNVVWANSLRFGAEKASAHSRVPLSQRFFTGGGSTLRGFPLNGAGPQSTIPVCSDPAVPATCAFIRVPTGGAQLLIVNSELRLPVPLKKGLSMVLFYDGGNVYDRIGFKNLFSNYTNSVGLGARYATPIGPVRVDIGHNLNGVPGIKATQIFITLGQAF
jgi:outer membrane protein insertion porin family